MRISDWSSDVCSSDLIGSYCGKSTVYIGVAVQANASVLYALDHHQGSEENQKGWEHHDETLYDAETDKLKDRKSVVSGQSVSVRVDLGGRGIIKKKTTVEQKNNMKIKKSIK